MTTRRYRHAPFVPVSFLALLIAAVSYLLGGASVPSPAVASMLRVIVPAAQAASTQSPLLPNVDMHIDFGFAGRFRPGYWTPVRVTLQSGPGMPEATLVAHTMQGSPIPALAQSTTHQYNVTLPPGVSITVEMVVYLAHAFHPLRFDLLDNTGRVLVTETLDLQRRTIDGDFLVALDDSGHRWSWLEAHLGTGVSPRGQRLGFEVVYVARPQQLPTSWLAYHGVTAVGISAGFPLGRLAPAQAEALKRWVTTGGHLVWSGGSELGAARGVLAEQLAPVAFSGRTVSFHHPALGERYAPLPAHTPLVLWEATPRDGTSHVLAGTPDAPLVSRHFIGRGTVFFTAFDPYVLASQGWAGMGTLGRDMLSGATPLRTGLAEAEAAVWQAMDEHTIAFPGPLAAMVSMLCYVGMLGVVWTQGGRGGKLTVTAVGIVFFAVLPVFIIGPATRTSRHIALTVSASLVDEHGTGESWHFRGLWSAAAETWPLADEQYVWAPGTANRLATAPTDPDVAFIWAGAYTGAVQLAPRQTGRLRAVSPATLPLATQLSLQGQQYRLTVINDTADDIEHMFYVYDDGVVSLGSLAAGSSLTQSLSSTLRSAEALTADWLSRVLLAQMIHRGSAPDSLTAQTMAALVRYRHRTGARGRTGDDGFVVGVFAAHPANGALLVSGGRYHVFVADVSLQATKGKV